MSAIPLNEDWPHKSFEKAPEEIHISPRTAYFYKDGEVHFLRLEELTEEDVEQAYEQLRAIGVEA